MAIQGLGNRTVAEVQAEVAQGGRFVVYLYCISLLVVTFRRSSEVRYLAPGESAFGPGLPYTLLSFFLGWWGFPFGLIFTPWCIIQNLAGGKNVTADIMNILVAGAGDPAPAPAPAPGGNGWVGG